MKPLRAVLFRARHGKASVVHTPVSIEVNVRFLIALLLPFGLWAQQKGFTSTLTTATTTQAVWTDSQYHTVQIVVTGGPSACAAKLEGSLDNVNWFDLSGSQTCTSSVMFHVDGKPITYARVNLSTWTGGTAAVITYRGQN
jgi:hypothetical protein